MISLISVILNSVKHYIPYLLKSLTKFNKINEVLFPTVDKDQDFYKEWQENNITFKMFGAKHPAMQYNTPNAHCLHHALGLHAGINLAKNDYVMTCDPDIFFCSDVDNLYLKLMETHKLNCIGVSHPSAVAQCFGFFPNVLNMMFRKSEMPDERFLDPTLHKVLKMTGETDIALPGMFLVPYEIPDKNHYFPNPNGHYETGCNLLLWALDQNWRWLSFQTADCHNYTTKYFKNNTKISNVPKQKLLYHVLHGGVTDRLSTYIEEFNIEFPKES